MLQIPSCTEADLRTFDAKLLIPSTQKPMSDKRKKELFRNLIQDAIGKNLSQQFRKEVTIKNLAPLLLRSNRHKAPPVDHVEHEDIGLCALFTPNSSS
jgi:hypothetical protein